MEENKAASPLVKTLITLFTYALIVLWLGMIALIVMKVDEFVGLSAMGVNSTFFVCLAIFLFTFFVVNNTALKPTSKMLIERDKRMDGREKEIIQIREELYEASKALDEERKLAQKSASEKFSEIKGKAIEEQRRTLQEARDKATSEMKKLKDKLEQDFENEKAKLDAQTDELSTTIFTSLLKSSSSSSDARNNVRTGA